MWSGVPAELLAQGPAGGREGPVQGGAALGGPAHPDGPQAQAERGQATGEYWTGWVQCKLHRCVVFVFSFECHSAQRILPCG